MHVYMYMHTHMPIGDFFVVDCSQLAVLCGKEGLISWKCQLAVNTLYGINAVYAQMQV